MGWYAVEEIDEAVERTRELLLPFDLGTWLRLALIIIFTGSGFSFFNFPSVPADTGEDYSTGSDVDVSAVPETASNSITGLSTASSSSTALIWMVLGLIAGVVFVLMYLSSVFEFIFYQSLLDEEVKVRRNFSLHSGRGLRYFGFRLGYLATLLLLLLLVITVFWINILLGVLTLFPALLLIAALSIFAGLTRDFVLIEMIETEEGVFSSWRSFWPSVREEWKQILVYLAVKLGLGIAIGLTVVTAVVFGSLILLIPFGIIGVLLSMITSPLAIPVALAYIFTVAIGTLFLMVPLNTFMKYFIILVYQDLKEKQ